MHYYQTEKTTIAVGNENDNKNDNDEHIFIMQHSQKNFSIQNV